MTPGDVPAELLARVREAMAAVPHGGLSAEAAIAAVRAFDLARQPYATRDADGTVTIVWPQGRADALWVSADLLEQLMRELAEPDQDVPERAAPPPRPAPTGVPRCHGRVSVSDAACTLPLGHHGGCR